MRWNGEPLDSDDKRPAAWPNAAPQIFDKAAVIRFKWPFG